MFNHQDVLRTASYQAQVAGSKRWHVCAPSESKWIGRAGGVDAFDPDYVQYPLFRNAKCFDDVVETGEMIFYPADYWHQTENVQTPTISVTATVMDANNYQFIIDELEQECKVQKFKWGFSKELCQALQGRCFAFWKKQFAQKKVKDEL
jgi:ribosomal protein L16 Arg81 hydroxylase